MESTGSQSPLPIHSTYTHEHRTGTFQLDPERLDSHSFRSNPTTSLKRYPSDVQGDHGGLPKDRTRHRHRNTREMRSSNPFSVSDPKLILIIGLLALIALVSFAIFHIVNICGRKRTSQALCSVDSQSSSIGDYTRPPLITPPPSYQEAMQQICP
jgi:hypothetical protein